jgi:hypothetical protein
MSSWSQGGNQPGMFHLGSSLTSEGLPIYGAWLECKSLPCENWRYKVSTKGRNCREPDYQFVRASFSTEKGSLEELSSVEKSFSYRDGWSIREAAAAH